MKSATKVSIVVFALAAGLIGVAHAAGGIKGASSELRATGIKGPAALRPPPQQQQIYLPPPPPPPPAPLVPIAPPPPPQQAIKGPGQVTPVFSAARVQPLAPAPFVPAPAPVIIQEQQQQQQQIEEQEPIVQQQQQQQVAEEVDPNAAAQDAAPAVVAPAAAAPAAASEEEANPRPEPYAFQYAFNAGDAATSGSSQREEQQDANGRVTGFYTLRGEDGRDRRVDYVADANGFRATISTNELGTSPKDSADVDWNAQAPSEAQLRNAELATQAARQRELDAPRQQPIAAASSSFGPSTRQQQVSAPSQLQQQFAAAPSKASKISAPRPTAAAIAEAQQVSQLQEPFEQIRQVELKGRARKSRHAPFYLFTV